MDTHYDRALSPFRYPGGKAFLSTQLAQKLPVVEGDLHYAEPFCGGAGAALILLKAGAVQHLHLNDADVRIFSSWKAMLDETELFIEKIKETPVTLDTWYQSAEMVRSSKHDGYNFDLGFAAFFLNRTSRSGIIVGAGPIGGFSQNGNWKIDARYNPERLTRRIEWLGTVRDLITLTNEDALPFLQRSFSRLPTERSFMFIDPPYVKAGSRLYLNAMNEAKHIALSDLLQNSPIKNWVLTYDDHPLIREIYSERVITTLNVNYSLQTKRKEKEILIHP